MTETASAEQLLPEMTPTKALILHELEETGQPMPYSRFMELSLYGPDGYYSAGKVEIGDGKDFSTTPEATSPLFGGALAEGLHGLWQTMGKPNKFDVVEMGAGRGVLARDIVGWVRDTYPEFYDSLHYTVVEYSPALIDTQQDINPDEPRIQWVRASGYQLPLAGVEGAFISNELIDAFPVEVVTRLRGELRQKYVEADEDELLEHWGNVTPAVAEYMSRFGVRVEEGKQEPINLNAVSFQEGVAKALKRGAIITIDYGKFGSGGIKQATRAYGLSLAQKQALARPEYELPGEFDITTDVNFSVLRKVGREIGLDTAFADSQAVLCGRLNADKVTATFIERALRQRDWQQIVALDKASSALRMFAGLPLMSNVFQGLVVTKGIENPQSMFGRTNDQTRADYTIPNGIPVKLWVGTEFNGQTIRVAGAPLVRGPVRHYSSLAKVTDGYIDYVHPHMLRAGRAKLIRPDGTLLVDAADPEQYRRLVERSGYRFETVAAGV